MAAVDPDSDISSFRVADFPPTLLYVPNFINEDEEEYLIHKVNSVPKPKWVYLSNRRLQNWGGYPSAKGMIAEPLPIWLKIYVDKVNALKVYGNGEVNANHVLINEYLPGQGILPHEDGPLFFPTIVTINLGSPIKLEFRRKPDLGKQYTCESGPPVVFADDAESDCRSVILEPRSVIIVKDALYTDYLHSISEVREDKVDSTVKNLSSIKYKLGDVVPRSTRISFTIRNVPKISKVNLSILNKFR